MDLISLLVTVIVIVIICVVVRYLVEYMGVPHPLSVIIYLVVGLVCLLYFLNAVGVVGSGPVIRFR